MANVHEQTGYEKDVSGDTWTVSRTYTVDDVSSDTAAVTAAVNAAGNMSPGTLESVNAKEIGNGGTSATTIYEIGLTWRFRASSSIAGGGSFSFDTSAATEKVYTALATTESQPSGAPDVGKVIKDGVDIYAPSFQWSETHDIDGADFTNEYVGLLYASTAKVNANSFRMFDSGEVLFLGASGASKTDSEGNLTVPTTFNYAARPNQTDVNVGSETVANKKGWQFVEVVSESDEDATAGREVPKIQGVYVHTVYEEVDFSSLYP